MVDSDIGESACFNFFFFEMLSTNRDIAVSPESENTMQASHRMLLGSCDINSEAKDNAESLDGISYNPTAAIQQ